MKVEIKIENLKNALNIVKDTIGKDSAGHQGIRLYVSKKTGRMKLVTNDGTYATETWVDTTTSEAGEFVAQAKPFITYINKLDVEKATLFINPSGKLTVKSKRGQQSFVSFQAESFQTPSKIKADYTFTLSGKVFKQLVNGVAFAAQEDKNRPILEGVNIISDGTDIELLTTNGIMIAHYKKKIKAPQMNLTVGKKSLVNATKIVKDDEKVTIQVAKDNRFVLKINDTSYHLPVLAGEYPDLRKILPKSEFPLAFSVEKDEFMHMLDRANAMLDTKGILHFEKGKVILQGSNEAHEFQEYIMTSLQGKANDIKIDIKRLMEIVKNIDAEQIVVGVRNDKPLTIRPDTKAKHTCLLTIASV